MFSTDVGAVESCSDCGLFCSGFGWVSLKAVGRMFPGLLIDGGEVRGLEACWNDEFTT